MKNVDLGRDRTIMRRALIHGTWLAVLAAMLSYFLAGALLLLVSGDPSYEPVYDRSPLPFFVTYGLVTAYLVFVCYFFALSAARRKVGTERDREPEKSMTSSVLRRRFVYGAAVALAAPALGFLPFFFTTLGMAFFVGYPRFLHALFTAVVMFFGALLVMRLTTSERHSRQIDEQYAPRLSGDDLKREQSCVYQLREKGRRVRAKRYSWVVTEPLGARMKFKSIDDLEKYCESV